MHKLSHRVSDYKQSSYLHGFTRFIGEYIYTPIWSHTGVQIYNPAIIYTPIYNPLLFTYQYVRKNAIVSAMMYQMHDIT